MHPVRENGPKLWPACPQRSYDLNYNELFMNKLHIKKQLVHLFKHHTYGEYFQTEKKNEFVIWIICCKQFAYISYFPNSFFFVFSSGRINLSQDCHAFPKIDQNSSWETHPSQEAYEGAFPVRPDILPLRLKGLLPLFLIQVNLKVGKKM